MPTSRRSTALQGRVENLKEHVRSAHRRAGRARPDRVRRHPGSLRDGGNLMERIVNEDMSWLSETDQRKILTPLMLMRRSEVEYRLTARRSGLQLVQAGAGEFREGVRRDRRRRDHEAAAQRPGEDLYRRVRAVDREHRQDRAPHRGHLGRDAPDAARRRRDHRVGRAQAQPQAADGVAASQARTKMLIIAIGIARRVCSACC